MKNKMFYIISILLALLFVSAVTAASYAYFVGSVNSGTINNTAVTTGNMEVEFTNGPEVTLENALPGVYIEKTFTVRNVGTLATTYDVYFSELVNTFADKSDLVYTLTSNDGGANAGETEVPATISKLVDSQPIGVNEAHTYTLRVEFKETNDNQDDNQGRKFKTVIRVNEFFTKESIVGFLDDQTYAETREYHEVITVGESSYPVHIYNYSGDQTWTAETVPNGGVFGTDDDIGTATIDASEMVVVKVDGDLTIGSGVSLQPYSTSYGGPKGFLIYVNGTLTNSGNIDNSHGAKAVGEDVYLWQNAIYTNDDDKFEKVPAEGGTIGARVYRGSDGCTNGASGGAGINTAKRATGGGGSGAACRWATAKSYSGAGGRGTSYSGGAGGGAISARNSGTHSGYAGSSTGGAGGQGLTKRDNTTRYSAGGGAGNPGGKGSQNNSATTSYSGRNGTGGLLIIYAKNFINETTGTLTAVGALGGYDNQHAGGGSSGGGSINIFYYVGYVNNNTTTNKGINVAGGGVARNGGTGGAGTVTIGSVATGTFVQNTD